MKILRVIYEWPPPWMGLAPAPFEMTRAQSKQGHDIDILCARWPKAGKVETLPRVNLHMVWRAPIDGTIAFTSSVLAFLKYLNLRSTKSFDVIHSHGHFGIWIYLYRVFLNKFFPWTKEMQIPLVVHFHNTVKGRQVKLEENESSIKSVSKYIDWPLAELSDKLGISAGDAYIFVSEDLKNEAIKYYNADPKKCFVVESGVNPELFMPVSPDEKAKTRIELNLAPEDKILLYVGALVERKNIHILIEALGMLPHNYRLILLGSGPEDYENKLTDLMIANKVKDQVLKLGYTPYPEVPIAYQAADLFVIPSSFEGLPKAAMEALACGLQVLAAGFSLKHELRGIEYLTNINSDEIAAKIKDMIQNPRAVDVYGVDKNYSWDIKAQQVLEVYDFAIKNFLK